ncbi:MAG: hypothetical protein GXP25_14600 [Planctomycetes bacterium]|nr:hypothetical protein [Planctomycetota bacterium]
MNRKDKMAAIVRAILLVLLGMLTFILATRVRLQTKTNDGRPAICAGCPLAKECGVTAGGKRNKSHE